MHHDTVSRLRPTISFARLCGACPLSPSRWLCAVLCVICTATTYDAFARHRHLAHDITAFLIAGSWISLLVHLYAILCSALLTGARLRGCFVVTESAQRFLFALNARQSPSPTRRSQLGWLAFLTAPAVLCALWFLPLLHPWLPGLGLILLVTHARLSLLLASLRLLDRTFALLNWHLADFNNRWPLFLPAVADTAFKEFACVRAFRRTKFARYGPHMRRLTAAKVAAFGQAHCHLDRALRALNTAFPCDLVTLTCATALLVACGSFRATGTFDPPALRPLWSLIALFHAASFLAVLFYATTVQERSQQTALLVQDLLEEEGHTTEVKDKLTELSQALIHRQASFTAAGFFNIDLKLISRLASVLAPITLFLVQNDNRPRTSPERN